MRAIKFTFWRDGDFYLGYLNEYPDYSTQGTTKEELVDLESGQVPYIHKVEELLVA